MNILFATYKVFLPEAVGGMQSSVNGLALSLVKRGHRVSMLCGLKERRGELPYLLGVLDLGVVGIRSRLITRFGHRKAALDRMLGYSLWRAKWPGEAIEWIASQVEPDIIAIMCGQPVRMAHAARATGVPLLLNLQNVEFHDHGGSFADLGNIPCVANSQFAADRYRRAFGVDSRVIHPIVDEKDYKTETTKENVTFINPHRVKGVDLAIEVARQCPEIPFAFVESWPLSVDERNVLERKLAGVSNVRLHHAVRDMRRVYGKCRILLAPSRWEESYGRVVSEAQFSGIPVVASNRGGLPEAVGSGGVLLDPDGPIDAWVSAVKNLWQDDAYHSALSAAARAYSQRPALNQARQVEMWEEAFAEAIERARVGDSSFAVTRLRAAGHAWQPLGVRKASN